MGSSASGVGSSASGKGSSVADTLGVMLAQILSMSMTGAFVTAGAGVATAVTAGTTGAVTAGTVGVATAGTVGVAAAVTGGVATAVTAGAATGVVTAGIGTAVTEGVGTTVTVGVGTGLSDRFIRISLGCTGEVCLAGFGGEGWMGGGSNESASSSKKSAKFELTPNSDLKADFCWLGWAAAGLGVGDLVGGAAWGDGILRGTEEASEAGGVDLASEGAVFDVGRGG